MHIFVPYVASIYKGADNMLCPHTGRMSKCSVFV